MFYIGINSAVNPTIEGSPLSASGIFSIISVYLFVIFYSFGWGPICFILAAECSPNHGWSTLFLFKISPGANVSFLVRSFNVATALMTQWLFNFVIVKITPIMLSEITYGTFLLFGSCCVIMSVYAVFFIPETKGVPLESIHELFEGNIMKGALQDAWPSASRARKYQRQRKATGVGLEGQRLEETQQPA